MWHTCQLIMIVSLHIINNNQIRCHSLGFCNVTGTLIYFKTIKLAIATTVVVNVHVPFNFTTWNKVVYTSGYVITYIIKITEPNHLILILILANKSYFIIQVNFCHLLAWFKNYDPLKVGVNSFWDTLYRWLEHCSHGIKSTQLSVAIFSASNFPRMVNCQSVLNKFRKVLNKYLAFVFYRLDAIIEINIIHQFKFNNSVSNP